ncbi:extracellular solute-binding protein [Nocardioides mesophilus]|uniref:Extracellular solute-binding protein n=1 Tax=Nocardioides mesophilus TaxID=433659 RepID=A0A7G9R8J2_9ACTN|nr:extracellular solute-binding protein [Nocardioides mesophilus]QNN51917.1 extracellular solute-binding protein [Nocardioides mesophilus]
MRRSTRPLVAWTAVVAALAATVSGCGFLGLGGDAPGDLQVYSARHYDLEQAFVDFEKDTGLKVDFIYGDDSELLERLKAEGDETPADLFVTVDAGNLWNAAHQGELAPVDSEVLEASVPAEYQDPENRWFGLALRARTVAYNPDAVDPAEFDTQDTYAGLGDPKWKGRLCMRDSTEAYTQSLVASLIDLHGRERAQEIVQGWMDNDVDIMSNDILLLEALDAGTCDVALVNHYYYARELADNPDLDVKLFWASQDGAGTHVNLSGAGIVKSSDAPEKAQRLLEWLASDGQEEFVGDNHEFPVNPSVQPDDLVASFGDFKKMPINAEAYGQLNTEAVDLLAEVGYE